MRVVFVAVLAFAAASAPLSAASARKKSSPSAPSIAAAIVVDMNAGTVLFSRAADTPRHPASLTKIMTLYVLFSYLRAGSMTLDSELVVTPHAASQAPTKLGL
ncbi:MAG: serine hydrolase, partial [Methyloceanibacter sp.]|uniref:serine hydrolase n=1 Tax=Methyloceanibacter sp. TaxID=1965321 RepID=UPI003D9AD685